MSKFDSSKFNAGATGTGISKILKPGTHYCRIADIQVTVPSFNMDALTITYVLVGPDLPDFEGMAIDKMNPSLGNYKGQAAYVRAGKYPFTDYQPPKGNKLMRDDIIFKNVCNFAYAIGVDVPALGIKGDTIEEFLDNLKPHMVAAGYFYVTLAGQEKTTEYGKNYNLYLPKNEKDASGRYLSPYYKDEPALKDSDLEGKMVLFNDSKHIDREAPLVASEADEVFRPAVMPHGTLTSTSGTTSSSVFTTTTSPGKSIF